ncbi:hypothetical protein TSUD_160490 [Trifolium subterraneum]|uniref:Integrase catalytic domain-containing protein n=1 Tax=Trifolium subterraneum TaxID=3900 RepID=A0A2Z6MSH8_TRISU|nr:hypothetical protein TSUD_160490 [Trifolium subterraneum]
MDLIVTFGENKAMKSVKVKFLVVDCPSLYNCIIGRPTFAELFAVSSTIHLKLKYYTKDGQVATINGDIEAARRCFEAASKNLNSVVTPKKKKEEVKLPGVNSINIEDAVELYARTTKKERKQERKAMKDDLLINENYRPIPDGEFELVPLGENPTKGIKIGADLPDLVKRQLKACLRENAELFAWSAAEMPGIDPEVACHQLTIDPRASAVVQRRRKQSPEKAEATKKVVKDLLEANFIAEAQYTTWLSNVVLVKKSNGKWRMCVDYTDLNRTCPKDAYPLPNIDKLVDNSSGFKLLSFMDAYSDYNQINMAEIDKKKTAFMTETGNYYYNVMSFGLKNAGATYKRMMNNVFHNEIGDMLNIYMDNMIVKSEEEIDHTVHLKKVFDQARKFNMRFNPETCTFGVKAGKFLGFYLTERGIEANPDKCRAFFENPTPKSKKSIQTLNGMLTSMTRFVAKSTQHALPLFKLLRKETTFEWTEECEGALQHLKRALFEPPVLTRPVEDEKLYLYLAVASEAISAVLIRETEQGQKSTCQAAIGATDMVGLSFPTMNNQADYEAFLAGLRLAEDMGAEEIKIYIDSQLVASQVSGEYQIKEERLLEYLNLIKEKLAKCEGGHENPEKRACSYVLLDDKLYRRGFSIPLLKCVEETRIKFILQEIHEGINRQHIGGRSLARKALREGYYWPTMQNDANDHVLKCDKCQRHGDMHLAPANELKTLISTWPFAWWGMDILGPFPTASRQVKYLIVAVDYFTKWIEAEPLAKIGATHILRFFKRNVLAIFGIPQVVVTDNGTQFTNKKFQEFLATIGTMQHFTSIEHPQTNGTMTSARANAQIAKSLATLTHLLARGDDPARDGEKRLDRFLKHKPSFFVGGFNPDGAVKWVEEVDIIFDAMECANENKLALGTYVLREEANQWWKNAKLRLGDKGVVITWEMFKREFFNKYFRRIPHYNTPEAENDKCVKFESGLRPDIKHIIGFAEIRNFTTLVANARICDEDGKAKSNYFKAVRGKSQDRAKPYEVKGKGSARSGKGKEKVDNDKCYRCGKIGHRSFESRHAEDPLLAIPIGGLGEHISPVEYRTIVRHVSISVKKEAPMNFMTDPQETISTLHPTDVLVFGWIILRIYMSTLDLCSEGTYESLNHLDSKRVQKLKRGQKLKKNEDVYKSSEA